MQEVFFSVEHLSVTETSPEDMAEYRYGRIYYEVIK